jgi:putative transposase
MARNYVFAPGEYYHLYARGIEKMPVFRDSADYQRFLEGLYVFNSDEKRIEIRELKRFRGGLTSAAVFESGRGETLTAIGAYCLMPSHFHVLVREKHSEGKGISKFMQKLLTSYTMYFNKKYGRTGAIFGSSFKAQHVTDDVHLKYLFAYIHLNPRDILDGTSLKAYPHSSYQDYLSVERLQKNIITPNSFPDYFSGKLEEEIEEWLAYHSAEV